MPESPYIDLKDAARYVHVSPESLRRAARFGRIRCYRAGERYLFTKWDLNWSLTQAGESVPENADFPFKDGPKPSEQEELLSAMRWT